MTIFKQIFLTVIALFEDTYSKGYLGMAKIDLPLKIIRNSRSRPIKRIHKLDS